MIIKRGVTSLEALERNRTILGFPKRFGLALYGEIIEAHPELDAWLPRILARHQTHRGAFKRTLDRRFEELDALVADAVVGMRADCDGPLRVHDLAVSDGRSSAELYDRLRESGPVEFTASDRDVRVDLVRPRSGRWMVAFDEDGHVVQYVSHGFVLSPVAPEHPVAYPVNRLVLAWLRWRLVEPARSAWREATRRELGDMERRDVGRHTVWRVPLICRACLEHIREGRIRFVRHDVCDPLPARYHLLRAMNVLNHLAGEDLRRALRSLREGLEDGGLLVVGRSADPGGQTRATVWRREGEQLRQLHSLHGGSEIAAEIEAAA